MCFPKFIIFSFPLIITTYLNFACVLCVIKKNLDEVQKLSFEQQGINLDTISDDTIFLTPPKLTDEDQGYKFMPKSYKCDGCRGVAYQLQKRFSAAEKKRPSGAKLSYIEVLDIIDELCKDEFKNYGLKNIMGVNMLSGEGLEAEKASGVVNTGGLWEKRMQKTCEELVDLYDEEVIYSKYRKNKEHFIQNICKNYCDDKKAQKPEL